jgi:hypothetical protein
MHTIAKSSRLRKDLRMIESIGVWVLECYFACTVVSAYLISSNILAPSVISPGLIHQIANTL